MYLTIHDKGVPNPRNAGYPQTYEEWMTHFLDIKNYLLKKKVSSCTIGVYIDTNEKHATHFAAYAHAATHKLTGPAVMNADLHQLLERLRAP